jgi:uncharacterized protein with gpF-like domain
VARKPVTIKPVRPSLGFAAAYRRSLDALISAMHNDLHTVLLAAYAATPPEMARDASPADMMRQAMAKLAERWQKRFDDAAPQLADFFALGVNERSDAALHGILKRAGFAIRFTMTRPMRDVLDATIGENVGLIRSIAQQHLGEVQGLVMRSVAAGRDLGPLADGLARRYAITRRRAALIARDQNNKATAIMSRTRHLELGITEAVWMHSGGGKTPRPSHLKAGRDGTRFNLKTGWFDPDEKKFILPGELINCRCVSRPILPGMERIATRA